jgi:transcriptional regulator with XRE-family HTH domain
MARTAKHHNVKSPLPLDAVIGQRIRAQRLNRHMSQTDLANALGLTFQQVQKYEKGVNRVGGGRLQQIAETLGVTPAFFFDGAAAGGASKADTKAIDAGIGLLRTQGALRVLRAYSEMRPSERQLYLQIGELFAGISPGGGR